jgi:predicted ABC-type ATPase
MEAEPLPRVVVLAGINGAGKTTASQHVLTEVLRIPTFVNADAIARGINGLNPESVAFEAGRIMLDRLRELALKKEDFAFETTLAARTYAGFLESLRQTGYFVYLYYYWLHSPELAISRVAVRVQSGGHHIPEETIRQRYSRSIRNFFHLYRPIADYWEMYDNSFGERELIAIGNRNDTVIGDEEKWTAVEDYGHG